MKISKAWLLILPLFWTNVAGFHAQTFFGQTQESEGVAAGNFLKDAFNCGKSSMGLPQRRILNGKDTIEGDWPWVVFLNPGCTGSIITRRHVLTAAHCAYNITEDGEVFRLPKITAIAGVSTTTISAADRPTAETTNSNASGRQSLYIKNIFIHPAYDYHDFTTPDIAVFEMAGEFRFSRTVRKICLPLAFQEDDGQIAFTVGWGADKRTDGYNKTETSEEALIPLNPAKRCVDQFRNLTRHVLEFNQENFICGGGTLRGTEIVGNLPDRSLRKMGQKHNATDTFFNSGDSGSPLMLNERGRWYQIGLTSFGEMGSNLRGLFFDVAIEMKKKGKKEIESEKRKEACRIRKAKQRGAYTRVAEFCPWISQMTNYEAKCLDMTKTASQQKANLLKQQLEHN